MSEILPDNCAVCILSPILTFGWSIGFKQIKKCCPHSQELPCRPKFNRSKRGFILPITMTGILFGMLFHQFQNFCKTNYSLEKVMILSECLYYSAAIILFTALPFITDQRMAGLNGFVELCNSAPFYGFNSILTLKSKEQLKNFRKGYVTVLSSLIISILLYSLWLLYFQEFDMERLKEILIVACIASQMSIVSQFATFSIFGFGLMENCKMVLIKNLSEKYPECKQEEKEIYLEKEKTLKINFIYVKSVDGPILPLSERISLIRSYYSSSMLNFAYIGKRFGLSLILWFLNILLILIVNIYILAQSTRPLTLYSAILGFRTNMLISNITFMLNAIQRLHIVVSITPN